MAIPRRGWDVAVTKETVEHYARLASLRFSEDEAELMAVQLGTILDYVDKISELDGTDIAATDRVLTEPMPLREDEAQPGLGAVRALAGAPDQDRDHFLVPKMIHKA